MSLLSAIDVVELCIVLLLGLVAGSFTTAITYREAHGQSWIFSCHKKTNGRNTYRSVCPGCKHVLAVWDLVPLFSWLCLRGRCRYCQQKISMRYPIIELCVPLAFLGVYFMQGASMELVYSYLAIPFLVALFVIDWEQMILPNRLVAALLVLGVAGLGMKVAMRPDAWVDLLATYIGGAFLYALIVWVGGWMTSRLLRKETLGFGDVKLFAVAGLWLGLYQMPLFFILSGVCGVFMAILWRLTQKGEVFPFGPALILTFYVLMIV